MAAALVFDAAPRMEYRHDNKTRLEAARELGLWLLAQLPEQSEIAVLDTRLGSAAAFQPDRGAAKERIARLESVANSQPLPAAIDAAVKLLRQSRSGAQGNLHLHRSLPRRLARGASRPAPAATRRAGRPGSLRHRRGRRRSRPTTAWARCGFRARSSRTAARCASRRTLSCIGAAAARSSNCTCWTPTASRRNASEQSVEAVPGELRPVEFHIGGLEPGTHQGFVRIVGQDGLAADDTRYFTVAVKPAWRVLVAAPKPAESYALFLAEALAPAGYRKRGQARFDCDICDLARTGQAAACRLCRRVPVGSDAAGAGHVEEAGRFRGGRARRGDLPGPKRPADRLVQRARRRRNCCRASCCGRRGGPTAICIWPRAIISTRSSRRSAARPARSPGTPFPCSAIGNSIQLAERAWASVLPYSDGKPALLERPVGQGARADDDHARLRSAQSRTRGICCRRARRGRS